jgi:hypothetical protein
MALISANYGAKFRERKRKMRTLLIVLVVAALAVPAMAILPLSAGSCPVNLKIMPIATVVAPIKIDVAITTIDQSGMGSSSGAEYGTFILTTNLATLLVNAGIQSPGISGGTWTCMAEGSIPAVFQTNSLRTLYGPFTNVPFNVFVKVTNVPMASNVWSPTFNYDTTLTLTLSAP